MRPIDLVSDAALAVMISSWECSSSAPCGRPGIVILAVGISLLVAPVIALGLAGLLGVAEAATQPAVVLPSMPVAFLSTIASPLTLTPLIAYLR